MKKKYNSPKLIVLEIQEKAILAASHNISITSTKYDNGKALSKSCSYPSFDEDEDEAEDEAEW